jgi:dTDP-4-dehydrorhamnose reductase
VSKIAILGSTGMLGSAVASYLSTEKHQVVEFNRSGRPVVTSNTVVSFDLNFESSLDNLFKNQNFDYIVNCVGLIKQLIDESSPSDCALAYLLNSDFPNWLNGYSIQASTPIIQIGTDCVFSGRTGNYDEHSAFDCNDIYGLSKAEGEERSQALMTIRTSIIGHELQSHISLMDWFLMCPPKSVVQGFTNHYWNGVTTLDFAKVVDGIISSGSFSEGVQHLVPVDRVSKFELLELFAHIFGRRDIVVHPFAAETGVNRTLATVKPERNSELWTLAGYNNPPTVEVMVNNYSQWAN